MNRISLRFVLIFGGLIGLILLLMISHRNLSKEEYKLNLEVQEKWTVLDDKFKERELIIPDLLNSVKHVIDDKELLKKLRKDRKKVTTLDFDTLDLKDYKEAQNDLEESLNSLLRATQDYPELEKNDKYLKARAMIDGINDKIAVATNEYNEKAEKYNQFTLRIGVFLLLHPDGKAYYEENTDQYKNMVKDKYEYLGIDLIDFEDFWELVIRFAFNLLIIFVCVRWLYYPKAKRKDYLFTYILISSIIFLLCFLLDNVKLQIGFALGLFAIFGIIRYRTDTIPIKEMTYLFLVIGISVINALANKKVSYTELVFTNFILLLVAFLLEHVFLLKHESTKTVLYEKIDLIKSNRREELIRDLEERTGLKINRIEIGRINFLRDTVRIKVYYYETDQEAVFHEDDYASKDYNSDI